MEAVTTCNVFQKTRGVHPSDLGITGFWAFFCGSFKFSVAKLRRLVESVCLRQQLVRATVRMILQFSVCVTAQSRGQLVSTKRGKMQ